MTDIFEERPALVQCSEAPILIHAGDKSPPLICEGCNDSVLVENYLAECFIGIGLQCFKCKHITMTPSLPEGEIFPVAPISLGTKGKYFITSSIINKNNFVITCDQELEISEKLTGIKKTTETNLELSLENLNKISDEINLLSGGRFEKHILSAKRSIAHKNPYHRENPLAWSIEMLKKQIKKNEVIMKKQTLIALVFLQEYLSFLARWKNHVYFPILINEICAYFYHSLIQIIIATYLIDAGNKVAINIAGKEDGKRTADLYIRTTGSECLFIEIKVPKDLEWTNIELKKSAMKKLVEKCLSNSRGQIDKNRPGVLVIGSTILKSGFLEELETVIKKILHVKGSSYPAIAGICIVGLKEVSLVGGFSFLNFSRSFQILINKNNHYYKENPIN